MSTNAVIARPTEAGRWEGTTVHWDGHPTGNGSALFQQVAEHYMPDNIAGAWRDLIYAHRTGYSTLARDGHPENNECYCHSRGEGMDPEQPLITSGRGWEWTYVLAPKGMHVLRYDYGLVVTVPWDYPGPDWGAIEAAGTDMEHYDGPGPLMFMDYPPALTFDTLKEIEK